MFELVKYACEPQHFPQGCEILCSRQFMVEECLELPCTKPDIERLVDVRVQASIESYKLFDSPRGKKMFIKGKLEQDIYYIAEAPCQPVHAVHFCTSFRTFMDLSFCCHTSYAAWEEHSPQVLVEFAEASNIDSRTISKSVILLVWYPAERITHCRPEPVQIIHPRPACRVVCNHRRY